MLNKAIQLVPDFREALFWRGILRFQNVNENLEDLQRALSLTKRDSCQYLIIQSQVRHPKNLKFLALMNSNYTTMLANSS